MAASAMLKQAAGHKEKDLERNNPLETEDRRYVQARDMETGINPADDSASKGKEHTNNQLVTVENEKNIFNDKKVAWKKPMGIISTLSGFNGKRITGLNDKGKSKDNRKPSSKKMADKKKSAKRTVSFNPSEQVKVFKNTSTLGHPKMLSSDKVHVRSKDISKAQLKPSTRARKPKKSKNIKKIVVDTSSKKNKEEIPKGINHTSPLLSDTAAIKKPEQSQVSLRSVTSETSVSRFRRPGRGKKQVVKKPVVKTDTPARVRWKKMGTILRLSSTMSDGGPGLLQMTKAGGNQSMKSALEAQKMMEKFRSMLKPKRGLLPRGGGVPLDRFRQHIQEKRHRGMGEVFVNTMGVQWQPPKEMRDWRAAMTGGQTGPRSRDPRGISRHVTMPWEKMVKEPACLAGKTQSSTCLLQGCFCTIQAPDTLFLQTSCRVALYTCLTTVLAPLIAGFLGCYMGLLLFLQVWLVRPLILALTMQAKLLKQCCSAVLADIFCLPLCTVWQYLLSTSRPLDLANLRSPLSSVFLTKRHTVNWDFPIASSGRGSKTRYPRLAKPLLPFPSAIRLPKLRDPGRMMRKARDMAAVHREWLAQVTVVQNALKLAMCRSDDRARLREQLQKDIEEKTKRALKIKKSAAKKIKEPTKPVYSPVEMGWMEKEIERPPPPKLTGLQLWQKARKIALDRSHRRKPKTFLDQAKKIVFTQAKDVPKKQSEQKLIKQL